MIYGSRRVEKTTLLKEFLAKEEDYLFLTREDLFVSEALSKQSIKHLRDFIGGKSLLVIDEAQYIPSIARSLKLIVDHIENVKVIVTGSSTFDLTKQIGEPLTGCNRFFTSFLSHNYSLNK